MPSPGVQQHRHLDRRSRDQAGRHPGRRPGIVAPVQALSGDEPSARRHTARSRRHASQAQISRYHRHLCARRCPDASRTGSALAVGGRGPHDHDRSREGLRLREEGVGPVLQGRGTDPDALRRICRRQERQVRACRQRPGLGPHGNIDWASPKATVRCPRHGRLPPCRGRPSRGAPPGGSRQAATAPAAAAHSVARGHPEDHEGGAVPGASGVAHAADLPLCHRPHGMHRPEALGSDRAAAGGPGTGRASGQEFQERQGPSRAPARDRPPGPRTLSRGAQAAGRTLRTLVRSRNRPAVATGLSDPNLHPARAQGGSSRRARRARPQAARPSPRIRRRRTGRQPLPQPEGRRPAHARGCRPPSDTPASSTPTGTSRRRPSSCARYRKRPRNFT